MSLSHQAPQMHNEAILLLLQLGPDNLGLVLIVYHRTVLQMRKDFVRAGAFGLAVPVGLQKQRHDTSAFLYMTIQGESI